MSQLFVLFEHAAGYTLFNVKQFEETGAFINQVEKSVLELKKFNSVVKLTAFYPFKSALNALENINSVSEGVLSEDLQLFLETNVPKPGKGERVILGVGETKLGAAITEALAVTCQHTGIVPEILRGIRYHFAHLVKNFTGVSAAKAQLGLGHSYSRAKVKFNVNRDDNMIIQAIALLDQLDKDINTFCMRIREWYSYHFPELFKIVSDNHLFAKAAAFIRNRKELTQEKLPELEEIVQDSAKAEAIFEASKSSMGMDISPIDLLNIERFSTRVVALVNYRSTLVNYLRSKMGTVAPNLASLIGEPVGARLISHAGSLTNLAKFPASTVQILGAEKALFRALKTRGNTPKYGLIFHSTFIGRAGQKSKGRISRYLANKCSLASRIDCFTEAPSNVFGLKMKDQVEDRLKFYETGDIPKKNLDVMREAIAELNELEKQKKKKKKKAKKEKKEKVKDESVVVQQQPILTNHVDVNEKVKKKKKRKIEELLENDVSQVSEHMNGDISVIVEEVSPTKKPKKKKRKKEADD